MNNKKHITMINIWDVINTVFEDKPLQYFGKINSSYDIDYKNNCIKIQCFGNGMNKMEAVIELSNIAKKFKYKNCDIVHVDEVYINEDGDLVVSDENVYIQMWEKIK